MLLILTGPAGAGKNTISKVISSKRENCAIVDVDTVRHMVVKPHKAPWEGEEGHKQVLLGVRNSTLLAENFLKEGLDVIILDVVSEETIKIYKTVLANYSPKIIMLLPSLSEVKKRNGSREYILEEERVAYLHTQQSELKNVDEIIDNTNLTAEETASKISQLI
jgi:dephospho-CoA kinase